jgi:hypothetical protein
MVAAEGCCTHLVSAFTKNGASSDRHFDSLAVHLEGRQTFQATIVHEMAVDGAISRHVPQLTPATGDTTQERCLMQA